MDEKNNGAGSARRTRLLVPCRCAERPDGEDPPWRPGWQPGLSAELTARAAAGWQRFTRSAAEVPESPNG